MAIDALYAIKQGLALTCMKNSFLMVMAWFVAVLCGIIILLKTEGYTEICSLVEVCISSLILIAVRSSELS